MSLGPRLVIPGVFLGCILLGVFLFLVTAGFSYPEVAQAAEGPAPEVPPENPIQVDSAEGTDPMTVEIDFTGPVGECQLNANYPDSVLQWCDLIQHYAFKRGLSPNLVASLILQESGGDSLAYSHSGAVGLMQVMPRDGLAASFMCRFGPCFTNRPSINELQDPEYNISYGTKMLAELAQKYGDIREALKAYGPMDVGYYYADIVLGLYQQYAGSVN